jgi:hypothetical protein
VQAVVANSPCIETLMEARSVKLTTVKIPKSMTAAWGLPLSGSGRLSDGSWRRRCNRVSATEHFRVVGTGRNVGFQCVAPPSPLLPLIMRHRPVHHLLIKCRNWYTFECPIISLIKCSFGLRETVSLVEASYGCEIILLGLHVT